MPTPAPPDDNPITPSDSSGQPDRAADPESVVLICAPVVCSVLAPEFDEYYLDLVDVYEEELTDDIVLNEVADFFSDLLARGGPEALIERCCAAFEALCETDLIDPVEALYDQVLSCLSPAVFERARPYFGPKTEALVDQMENVSAEFLEDT
ncbi:MAG: hypothetical protein ACYCSF_10675 [Acidimicrobiales bacterium]